MIKKYIKPGISVIEQVYNEGLMQNLSMRQGMGPSGTTGFAKPGGDWSNTWDDAWSDPTTEGSTSTDDAWGI